MAAKKKESTPNPDQKKPKWYKRRRFWKRFMALTILLPVILFSVVIAVAYAKQDEVVQELIETINEDFTGLLEVKGSHISPFEEFPYVCIDLEQVSIWEDKDKSTAAIMDVEELFLGFELWDILSGNMTIKEVKLSRGHLDLVQHVDGEFNIVKALTTTHEIEDTGEEFHLDLHEIILEEIDLRKLNEANNLLVDAYIFDADAIFRTQEDHIYASLDSRFELNLIKDGDTTFIKHKHIDVDTEFDFTKADELLTIKPTTVHLEGSEFNMDGSINVPDDVNLDLHFSGNKKNFELLFAMAPEELIPVLERYDNRGELFFDATVKGKSINGASPAIDATFGCKNAYFNNKEVNRKVDELSFVGHFSNGAERSPKTMSVRVEDFYARPESGEVSVNLTVDNFEDPEINLQMTTDFELEFLQDFFKVDNIKDLHGRVEMTMNFHDIVNLEQPEHAITKLNESYYTLINVEDLGFRGEKNEDFALDDLDLHVEVNGHEAIIDYCNAKVGNSDVSISGSISDLPAILHHTDLEVDSRLKIESKFLDLYQLTGGDSLAFDEQIKDLSLDLDFKSTARNFTEFKNLPQGEFYVENLYADLQHYPHRLHDFHADVIIDDENFKLVDFKGMIDNSDFLFTGELEHYDLWFMEHPMGDTKIDFNLASDLLRLEDLFSYKGDNYVPEDYRHEVFDDLHLHGHVDMHFKDGEGLYSTDAYIDNFESSMEVHHLRFEDFFGRVHYEKQHLIVEDFHGRLGKSDFKTTLHWYFGDDEAVKLRDNHFALKSKRLDFDELFAWNPPPASEATAPVDHDAGFNIYEVPFTDMTYDIDIAHLNYHRYLIDNIRGVFHTTPEHRINFEQCDLEAAGGSFHIEGYFNGSDPDMIYFSPDMKVRNVDLDKLLFKFENFGQDHLVSENLHGQFSGDITGKVHMHNDMVPKIDDSEIHMDVHVLNGRLENFVLLEAFADYFRDKNLTSVRFDTLDNHFDLTNGILNIPNMTINSSIGFMEFSGKQDMDLNFEYYVKVPWKLVGDAASSKLFGRRKGEVDPEQIDEIQYANDKKKTRYINLKMTGNPDDYSVTLGKAKRE